MRRCYLDYNAMAPFRAEQIPFLKDFLNLQVGNPSALHHEGRLARQKIEASRKEVADCFDVKADQIVFTSGATEANNWVVGKFPGSVFVSPLEHESIHKAREDFHSYSITSFGEVDLIDLDRVLSRCELPTLVCVTPAHNESGVIQPLDEILKIARLHKAYVHCDASQAIGRMTYDWGLFDYVSFSGYKLGALPGIGGLIFRKESPLSPLIKGGGQERSHRSGTQNLLGILSLAFSLKESLKESWDQARGNRDFLEESIVKASPLSKIAGLRAQRLPNTTLVLMPGVKNEVQLMNFDLQGFAVSTGSACSSGKKRPSRFLQALGYAPEEADTFIRISLPPNISRKEIEAFLDCWINLFNAQGSLS